MIHGQTTERSPKQYTCPDVVVAGGGQYVRH